MDHEVERPGDAGASAVALWDQAHFQAFSDLAQLTEPLFKFYINSRLRDIGVVAPAAVVTAAAVDNAVAQPVADASEASPWIGFNVSTQTVETLTRALDKVFPESDALRPHRRGLVCRLAMKLCRSYSWNVGSLRINGASIENVGHVSVGKRGTQKTLSVFFMPQDAEGNAFQLMCTATHKDSGSYKIQTSGSAKFPKGNTIDLV